MINENKQKISEQDLLSMTSTQTRIINLSLNPLGMKNNSLGITRTTTNPIPSLEELLKNIPRCLRLMINISEIYKRLVKGELDRKFPDDRLFKEIGISIPWRQSLDHFVSFKYLRVTTKVIIVEFSPEIKTEHLFDFLPITYVNITNPNHYMISKGKKKKLPFPCKPGSILSVKEIFENKTRRRGYYNKNDKGAFRNAVTINISNNKKIVNLKISRDKIQLTGVLSSYMAYETATYVFNAILRVQKIIDLVKQQPEKSLKTIEWLIMSTRGEIFRKPKPMILRLPESMGLRKKISISIEDSIEHQQSNMTTRGQHEIQSNDPNPIYSIKIPEEYHEDFKNVPDILPSLAKYLLDLAPEFRVHHDFINIIRKFMAVDSIIKFPEIGPTPTGKKIFLNIGESSSSTDEGTNSTIALNIGATSVFNKESIPSESSKLSPITERKFGITWVQKSLDNYNYDLGFNVDMMQLHQAIDGRKGFISSYFNIDSNEVKVALPYNIPTRLTGVIKANKQGKHFSFSVYRGGRVTQSGPCRELNKLAYYLFRGTIIEILSEEQYNRKVYCGLVSHMNSVFEKSQTITYKMFCKLLTVNKFVGVLKKHKEDFLKELKEELVRNILSKFPYEEEVMVLKKLKNNNYRNLDSEKISLDTAKKLLSKIKPKSIIDHSSAHKLYYYTPNQIKIIEQKLPIMVFEEAIVDEFIKGRIAQRR